MEDWVMDGNDCRLIITHRGAGKLVDVSLPEVALLGRIGRGADGAWLRWCYTQMAYAEGDEPETVPDCLGLPWDGRRWARIRVEGGTVHSSPARPFAFALRREHG